MRAVQVKSAKGAFELVERPIPNPERGWVRIKVHACGICHSDSFVKEGLYPGIQYPRVPGHEVAGVIDALGPEVVDWKVGQKVGVGWYGGHCNRCLSCRKGDFITCSSMQVTGISYDGGYADYMVAPVAALARLPEELSFAEAAPLLCAGITTFNALRNSGARPNDLVAILGIGGLGHLALQYAAKMGFHTVAIARGKEKEPLAKSLGAKEYIDSSTSNPADELNRLGGAKVILATVTHGPAMSAVIEGLGADGALIALGASDKPIEISSLALIRKRRSIVGWPSGTSIASEATLEFSALTGVRSMNELVSLEKAPEAYEKMMSNKARFRIVLTP